MSPKLFSGPIWAHSWRKRVLRLGINKPVLLLAAALLACTGERSAPGLAMEKSPMNRHLSVDDHTRDILQHPAFAGFAELILPSSGGLLSGDTPLNQIGSLLPYHSQVNPRHLAASKPVFGVILAARIGDKLKYAATQAPNVRLLEYDLEIKVRPCQLAA
jgi:endonuclease